MSFGGYNPGRHHQLPFSNTDNGGDGVPPSAKMRSRTGSLSSTPPPPPSTQRQQQIGSPYSPHPTTPTARESFYSGVGLNIHTSGYGSGGYNNPNNADFGSGSNPPVSLSSYSSSAAPNGEGISISTKLPHQQPNQPPAYSRRSEGGNALNSGIEDGGYSSGYDSPSGISTSIPYTFHGNQGRHHPLTHHSNQQQQQQHSPSYQQLASSMMRQSTQRYYPSDHSRTQSNASETSLKIDTHADAMHYSPGPASLSSASSSRRGSFSDTTGSGANIGGGFFARQRTYRPPAAGTISDADDDLDMDLSNKTSSRRHRQKRVTRKSTSNRNLLGDVGGVGAGKYSGGRMSGILNDWDMLLPSGDPYEDMDEDMDDDGMNENERWKRKQLTRRGWESRRGQGIILGLIVTVAMLVRIWKLAVPAAVVSEEQHLGGYIRDYLQGNFVVDVNPPLGKMLFSLVAYLLGYSGQFDFVFGKLYPKTVPFIGMRMFAATCGVALIPIAYLTIKRSGHSTQAAITCAILVTFGSIFIYSASDWPLIDIENALITQNRFMTLDAPMMLFMGYTLLAWINFYNYRNRPFTRGWWTWLLQTGIGLFLSSSVKWVGSFTILTIGLYVLKYLQESRKHLYLSTHSSHTTQPMRDFSKQITALSLCLLVLPVLLYMGLYAIDFQLLSKSGLGDSWVSPQFRMTLKGHDVEPVMADIAWQSKIHIRHANSNGGWIHSTPDQAIQLVEWDDNLTCWQVHPTNTATKDHQTRNYSDREMNKDIPFEGYIFDSDRIRLKHCYTKVTLSVNHLESIGSNKSFIREVRGIQWTKEATQDTIWRVELVPEGVVPGLVAKEPSPNNLQEDREDTKEQWHSIKGFRLFNEQQNCYLMSHKVYRATYSSYQEVGCIQDNRQKSDTIFIVDRNVNPYLPKSTLSHSYRPLNFIQKFIEINKVMWWSHHDLASPIHPYYLSDLYSSGKSRMSEDSHPWSWLFLSRGLNYYSSKETNNYIYLLGNPIVWWCASLATVFYVIGCIRSVFELLKGKNKDQQQRARFGLTPFYTIAPGTFCLGWFIHYAPYFYFSSSTSSDFGSRLFLHNYLPALYFSILLLVSKIDRIWQTWHSRKLRYITGFFFVLAVLISWYSLSPLAYGTDFSSRRACEQARSIGGWEFVCRRQNLPLARPQDAIAKIVIENKSDHDAHEEAETENNRFYFQAEPEVLPPMVANNIVNNDHKHKGKDKIDEGPEHDHEGPFNENERHHYDHEHFHHPPGHQHPEDVGHHHHGHGHAIHDPTSENHDHSQRLQDTPLDDETMVKQEKKQEKSEKMLADATQHANSTRLQKEKLVAEKLALEARQRELDEELKAQELRLKMEQERNEENQKEEKERLLNEQETQKDQEIQEQVRRAQEEREREREGQERLNHQAQEEKIQKKKEQLERQQNEERERRLRETMDLKVKEDQKRQIRKESEHLEREEQIRQLRELKERLQREMQERRQREEQENKQREEQERKQREEQKHKLREEQERKQLEEQERKQREEQARKQREEQERIQLDEQTKQLRELQERIQRDKQERLQREERQMLEQQEGLKREEQERLAITAEKETTEKEEVQKEKMTRQMLEEQVRLLQAQIDRHQTRSLHLAKQQDPHLQ
ncbi:hypothetical protein FBU30_005349 [Linnemannia zychae]|nr:hypothetical protein FBU30_005349 [Linnemannia zychae]